MFPGKHRRTIKETIRCLARDVPQMKADAGSNAYSRTQRTKHV
jgi:hypothetical protein